MAYVDDVNALIPTCDVELYLQLFKKYGTPLGAVLNTEKTRILTSTNNKSTIGRLLASAYSHNNSIVISLQTAIAAFSRDKDGSPLEVTDGLRVLGIPIGSHQFCTDFITEPFFSFSKHVSFTSSHTFFILTFSRLIMTIFPMIGWVEKVTSSSVSLL